MPKRKFNGAHRRVRSRATRQIRRDAPSSFERRMVAVPPVCDPYAPQFGQTVVLAVEMSCASCPTEMVEGAEATYIDGQLNCTECTWEAKQG